MLVSVNEAGGGKGDCVHVHVHIKLIFILRGALRVGSIMMILRRRVCVCECVHVCIYLGKTKEDKGGKGGGNGIKLSA